MSYSDDDGAFDISANEEDYNFDYDDESGEGEEGGDMDLENVYYNAKAFKDDDLEAAYEGFEQVAQSEAEGSGDWPFKAKKQMIKILFAQGKREEVLEQYEQLLDYLGDNKLSSSYAEKSFTNMLDLLTATKKSNGGSQEKKGSDSSSILKFVEKIYVTTLAKLVSVKNERMWIKTNLKLAKLYSDQGQVQKALDVLVEIKERCQSGSNGSGGDENNLKSSYLMEVYAQMISLYSGIGDYKKMKEIYRQTETLKSAVPHPRILGVISEAGGKMQMREKRYELARQAFFDSFKNYDEAGSLQRITVLKYFVVACMLSETRINPFESQETRPYRNDPKIALMVQLVEAFQRNDLEEFQRLLQDQESAQEIMGDPFLGEFWGDIEFAARSLSVLRFVRPYTRIKFAKIASALEIPEGDVVDILKNLILTTKLPLARLDSRGDYVELNAASVDINIDGHHAKMEQRWKSRGDGNKVTDLGQAKYSIGKESALEGLDDTNSTAAERAPYVGMLDGGLAPLVGVYQKPGPVLGLTPQAKQTVEEFVTSISTPLLLNSVVTDALTKASSREASSEMKSEVLKDCVVNVSSRSARSNVVFDIPRRYVQAAISEASAGTTKDGGKEGGEEVVGGGDGSGGNGGDGNNGGGNEGGEGNIKGNGEVNGDKRRNGDGVSGVGLRGSNGGSMEGGFSAGRVDPSNPFCGEVQSIERTLALVEWARAVGRLQKTTQRGGGDISGKARRSGRDGSGWKISSEEVSDRRVLHKVVKVQDVGSSLVTESGGKSVIGKENMLKACQKAAAEIWGGERY